MRLTQRQLNRATLARQMLLRREAIGAIEAVGRIVALQAQEPASPYLALWNRVAGFDPADLDRAFAEHAVVKASLLRVTLHAVHRADYAAFQEAMDHSLRASCLWDPRFTRAGLSRADADALIPDLVAFGAKPRTNADIEAWLDERLGRLPKPSVWWALRRFAPLVHAPTGGPWSFGPRPAYVAAPDQSRPGDRAGSMRHMAERYLRGFGPASAQDLAQFSTIYRPPAREALETLVDAGQAVRLEGPDGQLFDVPDGAIPPEDSPAPPRLMAMWDSVLLAHVERRRVVPADYRKLVIRNNGDVLPTLLVDGYVAGVWRPLDGGIEATAFHRLGDDDWDGLEAEARALVAFLGQRDAAVYRRYQRWWEQLPAADVRVLGAQA